MCEVAGGGMVTVYTFYNCVSTFLSGSRWLVLVDIDIGLDAGITSLHDNKSDYSQLINCL